MKVVERLEKAVAPTQEQPVRLEQWRVCEPICYFAGKRAYVHLHGRVYNHPTCPDGELVCTSELVALSPPVAVTKSRVYHLVGAEAK